MVYHNDYTNTIAKKVPGGSNELAPGTYTLTIYVKRINYFKESDHHEIIC